MNNIINHDNNTNKRRSGNDQGSKRQQGFWTNLQLGWTSLVDSTRQS